MPGATIAELEQEPEGQAILLNLLAAIDDKEFDSRERDRVASLISRVVHAYASRYDPVLAQTTPPLARFVHAARTTLSQSAIPDDGLVRDVGGLDWMVKLMSYGKLRDASGRSDLPLQWSIEESEALAEEVLAKVSSQIRSGRPKPFELGRSGFFWCGLTDEPIASDGSDASALELVGRFGLEPKQTGEPFFLLQVRTDSLKQQGGRPVYRPLVVHGADCEWFKHRRSAECRHRLGRTADLNRDFDDGFREVICERLQLSGLGEDSVRIDFAGHVWPPAQGRPDHAAFLEKLAAAHAGKGGLVAQLLRHLKIAGGSGP